jgi:hypothetical protein
LLERGEPNMPLGDTRGKFTVLRPVPGIRKPLADPIQRITDMNVQITARVASFLTARTATVILEAMTRRRSYRDALTRVSQRQPRDACTTVLQLPLQIRGWPACAGHDGVGGPVALLDSLVS